MENQELQFLLETLKNNRITENNREQIEYLINKNQGSNLFGENLSNVDLQNLNFYFWDFALTDFTGANLANTSFTRCNLRHAIFDENIRKANLTDIKQDLFLYLSKVQIKQILYFRKKLNAGMVDGATYGKKGERCKCLVGFFAEAIGVQVEQLPDLEPSELTVTEIWIKAIYPGLKPSNNIIARITREWIDEFIAINTPWYNPLKLMRYLIYRYTLVKYKPFKTK